MRRLLEGYGGSQALRRRGRHAALAGCSAVAAILALNAIAGDEASVSGYVSDRVGRCNTERRSFVDPADPHSGMLGAQATAVGRDGRLYVASELTDSVLRFDPLTYAYLDTFVPPGSGGLDGPTGLVFDAGGDLLVGSFETDQVLRYDGESGAPLGEFVKAGEGGLNGPDAGMTIGPDGNLYVPSYWNRRVLRYNGATGAFMDAFMPAGASSLNLPHGVRFQDGYGFVGGAGSERVDPEGAVTGVFVKTAVEGGGLGRPASTAPNAAGELHVESNLIDDNLDREIRRESLEDAPPAEEAGVVHKVPCPPVRGVAAMRADGPAAG